MFTVNDDLSIYATRGDIVFFFVSAMDKESQEIIKFQVGEWLESLNGKSAYAYAKEGGFKGTEAEFAQKLASL